MGLQKMPRKRHDNTCYVRLVPKRGLINYFLDTCIFVIQIIPIYNIFIFETKFFHLTEIYCFNPHFPSEYDIRCPEVEILL